MDIRESCIKFYNCWRSKEDFALYLGHLVLLALPRHFLRVKRVVMRADEDRLPPVMRIFPFGDNKRPDPTRVRPDHPPGQSGKSLAVRTDKSTKDISFGYSMHRPRHERPISIFTKKSVSMIYKI